MFIIFKFLDFFSFLFVWFPLLLCSLRTVGFREITVEKGLSSKVNIRISNSLSLDFVGESILFSSYSLRWRIHSVPTVFFHFVLTVTCPFPPFLCWYTPYFQCNFRFVCYNDSCVLLLSYAFVFLLFNLCLWNIYNIYLMCILLSGSYKSYMFLWSYRPQVTYFWIPVAFFMYTNINFFVKISLFCYEVSCVTFPCDIREILVALL